MFSLLHATMGPFDSKTRKRAPSAVSLLDPKGVVPPKWTGRPRATAVTAANGACMCPSLGFLAVMRRVLDHPPVAAPRASTRPLTVTSRFRTRPRLSCLLAVKFTAGDSLRPEGQCLKLSGHGSFSPASEFDAGSHLSHGRCNTHNRQSSPSFVRADSQGWSSLTPTSVTACVYANPRRSRSLGLTRRVGGSSEADVPPDFSRTSKFKSGGFQCSERQSLEAYRLVAAPFLADSCTRECQVLGVKMGIGEFEVLVGQHPARCLRA